jgi:outer membrane lipoprotein-sorting protein
MKLIFCAAVLALALIHAAPAAHGEELSARQIMLLNEKARKAQNESASVSMLLKDKEGKQRTRQVIWLADDSNEINRRSLIRFTEPKDVEGTGFLNIARDDRDDERWLYLPALRKTRRISGSDKSDNFMGTDFAYEDLSVEDGIAGQDHHDYRILRSERMDGYDCWVIEAAPASEKEKAESGYGKRELWITKDRYITIYTKYWDKNGVLFKHLRGTDIRPLEGATDQWRARHQYMENLRTRHSTLLIFYNFKGNQLTETAKIFNVRYLESGR